MKFTILFATLLSVTLAEVWHDGNHYAHHQETVESARRKAGIDSLGSVGSVSGGNANLVAGGSNVVCGPCVEGQISSSDAEVEQINNSNGVGFLYPSGGVVGGGLSSSSSLDSASEFQTGGSGATILLPAASSGSNSQISSSSSNYNENIAASPVVIPVVGGGGSESVQSSYSQKILSESAAPVVQYPISIGGGHSSQSSSQLSQSQAGGAVVPAFPLIQHGGGIHSSSLRQLQSSQQVVPTPLVYTYSSPNLGSRFSSSSSNSQKLVSGGVSQPVITVIPTVGGGNLYQSSQSSQNLVNSGLSGGIAPVYTYGPSGNAISSANLVHQSSSSNSGGLGGVNGLAFYPSSGLSGNQLATRFDSSNSFGSSGLSSGLTSSGLSSVMSESERLALLQAQSSSGSLQTSSLQGASSLGASSLGASSLGASSLGSGIGLQYVQPASSGYSGTNAWEKSSKWASNSEYDSRGTTKSNSYLTTAEGEDRSVNGRTSGYKASTTTVDNDGRRSTYSVST